MLVADSKLRLYKYEQEGVYIGSILGTFIFCSKYRLYKHV
jgi:hypothetical protein